MSLLIPHVARSVPRRLNAEVQAADIIGGGTDDPLLAGFEAEEEAQQQQPEPEPVTVPIPESYQSKVTRQYIQKQIELEGGSRVFASSRKPPPKRVATVDPSGIPAAKRRKTPDNVLLDGTDDDFDMNGGFGAGLEQTDSLFSRFTKRGRDALNERNEELDNDMSNEDKNGEAVEALFKQWASRNQNGQGDLPNAEPNLFPHDDDDNDDHQHSSHPFEECFFCVYEGKAVPPDILVHYKTMLSFFDEKIASMPAYKLAEAIYKYYESFVRPALAASVPAKFHQRLCPKMSVEIVYSHIMICTRDPRVFQAMVIDMSKRLTFRLMQNCETMLVADFMNRHNGNPAVALDKKMLTLAERWIRITVFLYKLDPRKCAFYNPYKERPITSMASLGLMPVYDLTHDLKEKDEDNDESQAKQK